MQRHIQTNFQDLRSPFSIIQFSRLPLCLQRTDGADHQDTVNRTTELLLTLHKTTLETSHSNLTSEVKVKSRPPAIMLSANIQLGLSE